MAIVPSDDYAGQITTGDGGYPHGKAKNVAVAGDGTGTPLEAAWVNDIWGFLQELLERANITPSGDPDEVGASDYVNAIIAYAADSSGFLEALSGLRYSGLDDEFPRVDDPDAATTTRKLMWAVKVTAGRTMRIYLTGSAIEFCIGCSYNYSTTDWDLDGGASNPGRLEVRMEGTGSSPTITAYSELNAGSWDEFMVLRLHPADDPGASSGFVSSNTIFPSLIPRLRAEINASAGDTTPTISNDSVGISACSSTANTSGLITCTFHANAQPAAAGYTVICQGENVNVGDVSCQVVVQEKTTSDFTVKIYTMAGAVMNLGTTECSFSALVCARMY
jgi:hypothetical protein